VETHAIERKKKEKKRKKEKKENEIKKKEPTSRYIPTNSNAAVLLEPVLARVLRYTPTAVLQARHVADFRAGELACEYKTPCIGSQKGMGGGGGRRRGEGGRSRETDWLRICMPKPFLLIGGGGGGGGLSAFS